MQIKGFQKTTLMDYPDVVSSLVFTGGCNFKCPFCHNAELVLNPNGLPTIMEDVIIKHLRKRKGIIDGLVITGGEPTILKGLIPFMKRVKNEGVLLKLDTNGYAPDILEVILAEKLVDYIAMDFKATYDKYSEITGIKNFDIDRITKSVNLIIKSGVKHEFRTTVIKEFHTNLDLLEISHTLKGANKYVLQQYVHSEEQLCAKKFKAYTRNEMSIFKENVEAASEIGEVGLRCK